MIDGIEWFAHMKVDLDLAQEAFEAGNDSAVHYFLGRLVGVVRLLRDLMSGTKHEDVLTPRPANNEP